MAHPLRLIACNLRAYSQLTATQTSLLLSIMKHNAPFGLPYFVSGINFLVLPVNLIPIPLSLTCLFMLLHIYSLCQLTTLTIHNSLSLSLQAQDLSLSQIFPTTDSLPATGLTPRTLLLDHFF